MASSLLLAGLHVFTVESCLIAAMNPGYEANVDLSEAIRRVFSIGENRWDEKAGLQRDALSSQLSTYLPSSW